MCRFILDVNDHYGTTVVLIEHDMGVVMDISDRVVVLDYGRRSATARRTRCAPTRTSSTPISASRTEQRLMADFRFFIEVLVGGLLSGVMYALVALGFVLIYKASGVFNFAQGAMVLFAVLSFVGIMELGLPFWAALPVAVGADGAGRHGDRALRAAPAGEPERRHAVDGDHRALPS